MLVGWLLADQRLEKDWWECWVEHRGCSCTGTQQAYTGPADVVAPPASDGLREAVGVFWSCY